MSRSTSVYLIRRCFGRRPDSALRLHDAHAMHIATMWALRKEAPENAEIDKVRRFSTPDELG